MLHDFMAESHFGRHVRRMRQLYAERLSVLDEGVKRTLGGLLERSAPPALLLGFAAVDSLEIRRGVEDLARALTSPG